jgi:hypothetical protein
MAGHRMGLEGIVSKKADNSQHSGDRCGWIMVSARAGARPIESDGASLRRRDSRLVYADARLLI